MCCHIRSNLSCTAQIFRVIGGTAFDIGRIVTESASAPLAVITRAASASKFGGQEENATVRRFVRDHMQTLWSLVSWIDVGWLHQPPLEALEQQCRAAMRWTSKLCAVPHVCRLHLQQSRGRLLYRSSRKRKRTHILVRDAINRSRCSCPHTDMFLCSGSREPNNITQQQMASFRSFLETAHWQNTTLAPEYNAKYLETQRNTPCF